MKASRDSSAILIATRKKRLVSRWSRFLQRIAAIHVLRQSALIEAEVFQRRPRFLFLDLAMMPPQSIEASVRAIRRASPGTAVVALASKVNRYDVIAVLRGGAHGYCLTNIRPNLLGKAVARIQAGEIWVGRRIINHLVDELRRLADAPEPRMPQLAKLTPRQREIATLIGNGASNREIASQLRISEKTVKTHVTGILLRLDLPNRVHVALIAGAALRLKP